MNTGHSNETMLDAYIYETIHNLEQLETSILSIEKNSCFTPETVSEIFRIMHTIKGSSAMMRYNTIAALAHAVEDLFYFIREEKPQDMDCALLSDYVLAGVDFIKGEIEKIEKAEPMDGDPSLLIENIEAFLGVVKSGDVCVPSQQQEPASPPDVTSPNYSGTPYPIHYEVLIFFENGCEMENIRAFSIVHHLKEFAMVLFHLPEELIDYESAQIIQKNGFRLTFGTDKSRQELLDFFSRIAFIRDLELNLLSDSHNPYPAHNSHGPEVSHPMAHRHMTSTQAVDHGTSETKSPQQSLISVDVAKLDKMMDLMGEMVIAEAMVTQNPELKGLPLNSFYKAARQLRKITSEMQDMVMSVRMVPLALSFHKMHRVVRDMSRALGREVELVLVGEETEVDKNIIEHISDPLMHLVRNAVDHGIEDPDVREAIGKARVGSITLEAKNAGSDVLILVKDDGKGINRNKIIKKACANGLIQKPEQELTDKEVYNLLFAPGFSTNDKVTEFSGRGVGMDVVTKNLESIGGSVSIESTEGMGTVTTLKIPLTLAIIDGMNIRVGSAKYTLPTTSIRETFQAKATNLLQDPEGNEMIMVRGECYPVLRLHKLFGVQSVTMDLTKGIMLMIEQDERCLSLFADELLGQHQVVVKALPAYMKNIKKVEGLAGCTLLSDGSVSLILNIGGLLNA